LSDQTPNNKTIKIGVIKPSTTSNSFSDLGSLLPDDIELVPEYMGFKYKSIEEFLACMPIYADKVASLVGKGCEIIHPEGAPPFMLQGLAKETAFIKEWSEAHNVPVFTTGTTQVAAMAALGVERFIGLTPFAGVLADAFRQYFTDVGLEVIHMGKPVADDATVYDLTTEGIRDHIIDAYRAIPGDSQALYILGSGWRVLDVIEELEAALDVPVLHPVVVRCWYILTMLGRSDPIAGHGRLLATMPPFAA
jgi:maleate cis-trans isomerase